LIWSHGTFSSMKMCALGLRSMPSVTDAAAMWTSPGLEVER